MNAPEVYNESLTLCAFYQSWIDRHVKREELNRANSSIISGSSDKMVKWHYTWLTELHQESFVILQNVKDECFLIPYTRFEDSSIFIGKVKANKAIFLR